MIKTGFSFTVKRYGDDIYGEVYLDREGTGADGGFGWHPDLRVIPETRLGTVHEFADMNDAMNHLGFRFADTLRRVLENEW